MDISRYTASPRQPRRPTRDRRRDDVHLEVFGALTGAGDLPVQHPLTRLVVANRVVGSPPLAVLDGAGLRDRGERAPAGCDREVCPVGPFNGQRRLGGVFGGRDIHVGSFGVAQPDVRTT